MSKWVKVNSNGQIQLNIYCYEKDISFGKPAEKRNLMLIYFSSEMFFSQRDFCWCSFCQTNALLVINLFLVTFQCKYFLPIHCYLQNTCANFMMVLTKGKIAVIKNNLEKKSWVGEWIWQKHPQFNCSRQPIDQLIIGSCGVTVLTEAKE